MKTRFYIKHLLMVINSLIFLHNCLSDKDTLTIEKDLKLHEIKNHLLAISNYCKSYDE